MQISLQGYFNTKDRNKATFKAACEVFKLKDRNLRGHVEFIYAALKHMEEYGVHKDLEVNSTYFSQEKQFLILSSSVHQY